MLFFRCRERHDAQVPGVADGSDLIVESTNIVLKLLPMFREDRACVIDGIQDCFVEASYNRHKPRISGLPCSSAGLIIPGFWVYVLTSHSTPVPNPTALSS
jgi:hypothetical protein